MRARTLSVETTSEVCAGSQIRVVSGRREKSIAGALEWRRGRARREPWNRHFGLRMIGGRCASLKMTCLGLIADGLSLKQITLCYPFA